MPSRRRCPVCGSKQWRKEPSSGLITCGEGHVLQNYRNETSEVNELGPHQLRKRTIKSGRKKKEKMSNADPKLYHGERARFHYFQCLQLIVRMQIEKLIKVWGLPPEFEIVCRDLWALHLSLLPNPPPAEPYHYFQQQHGGRPSQEPSSPDRSPLKSSEVDENGKDGSEQDQSSSSSSSSSEGEDEDSELEQLLRANSETPSSSDESDSNGATGPPPRPVHHKRKRGQFDVYDAPANTLAVLMVGCWTLRLPVMYMDFIRLVEAYELPYLDPTRLLPANMVLHLTKHTVQALSPHHAPTPLHIHKLTSRLAKLINRSFGVLTPEFNTAPLLWRAVRGLHGTPTLYNLAKRLGRVLSLPMTLHHSLAPSLKRVKRRDPEWHKYDNAPPEVALVATVIVVLKMVYGLDGQPRTPRAPEDPACALPTLAEYLQCMRLAEEQSAKTSDSLFSTNNQMSVEYLDEDMLDKYLYFCENALLPRKDRNTSRTAIDYFPLERASELPDVPKHASEDIEVPARMDPLSANVPETVEGEKRPGEAYPIYNTRDVSGSLPPDCEAVIQQAARWAGVDDEYICGVVEMFERRVVRWWDGIRRREN